MKHLTDVSYYRKLSDGRRFLIDIFQFPEKTELEDDIYVMGRMGETIVRKKIIEVSSEKRVKAEKCMYIIESFAKMYIKFLFNQGNEIPTLRFFTLYGNNKISGMMYSSDKANGIPIISHVIAQDLKEGCVRTSDGEVFFLDWTSMSKEMEEAASKLGDMLDNKDDVFTEFLGNVKAMKIFPEEEMERSLLANMLYEIASKRRG